MTTTKQGTPDGLGWIVRNEDGDTWRSLHGWTKAPPTMMNLSDANAVARIHGGEAHPVEWFYTEEGEE